MYPIDFNTCTMADVIKRSVVCHPSLFADALVTLSVTHSDFAKQTYSKVASRIALRMSEEVYNMAMSLHQTNELPQHLTYSQQTIAFGAASKLQCIPRSTASDIAERGYQD